MWFIHLCSAAMTALVIPEELSHQSAISSFPQKHKTEIILSAAKAMCLVCCWVVLFRILISFLKAWFLWILPVWMQVLLMGVLELVNGCCALMLITDTRLRFVLCSCMLAFGGVCVLLQTISVTEGLSVQGYVKGKIMQTLFSLLLSCTAILQRGFFLAGVIPVLIMILRKKQNRYRNPKIIPV